MEAPIVKQLKCISAHWVQLVNMDSVRLKKRILGDVMINPAGLAKKLGI